MMKGQPLAMSLGLESRDISALVGFAQRDALRGELGTAIETLRVAVVLDPRQVRTWQALAHCYERAGDASRAASASRVAKKIAALPVQS